MSGPPKSADAPSHHVDAVGLTCPMPVLMTRKALRDLPAGTVIELRASDPLAHIDIAHFCAEQGHALIEEWERDGVLTFLLRKGG